MIPQSPFVLIASLLLMVAFDGERALLLGAEPAAKEGAERDLSMTELVDHVRPATVVIHAEGRDDDREALGAGFVIKPDGWIATNLHVIGEGRSVKVTLADGRKFEPDAVLAFDRDLDLALIRVAAKELPTLTLGDPNGLKQGQTVAAFGNPLGLEHSVVAGVLSAKRDINSRPMLQLAIPVERGNSGGPVVDLQGRVHGVMTEKSLLTANLGFAVSVAALKPLLERTDPIPMSRWVTIGVLDPKEWRPKLGARWRQRGGRLHVDGAGEGFGGRSFCIHQAEAPQPPYELAVIVKLNEEAGAAGLIFGADDGDKHFGFYPSGGGLRFTEFAGPDVLSWRIHHELKSPHYRPGDWNHLKVRVEPDRVLAFVNGQQVLEHRGELPRDGRVGLAKFRDTVADFRNFRVGASLGEDGPTEELRRKVADLITQLPAKGPNPNAMVETFAREGSAGVAALRDQARQLDRQAEQLRQLARDAHARGVVVALERLFADGEEKADLARAALWIARLDNEDVDVDAYIGELDKLGRTIAGRLGPKASARDRMKLLHAHLFDELRFRGSRLDYYNRANSYLSSVLDDREGLPITLSILYMELGRRIGMSVEGVALPGHFVVRVALGGKESTLVDPHGGGAEWTREAAAARVREITNEPLLDEHLAAVGKRAIVTRMLRNLFQIATRAQNNDDALRYAECLVALDPESASDRWMRAMLRARAGRSADAVADLDWLLDHAPPGAPIEELLGLRRRLAAMEENGR